MSTVPIRDKRTYQHRREYQREYQKRWRASQHGKSSNRKIYLKRRVVKSEKRQLRDARGKEHAFKSFSELFNFYEPVSVVSIAYAENPTFKVFVKGKRTTEWLSEPLPTWVDSEGIKQGGGKWNGADFI